MYLKWPRKFIKHLINFSSYSYQFIQLDTLGKKKVHSPCHLEAYNPGGRSMQENDLCMMW